MSEYLKMHPNFNINFNDLTVNYSKISMNPFGCFPIPGNMQYPQDHALIQVPNWQNFLPLKPNQTKTELCLLPINENHSLRIEIVQNSPNKKVKLEEGADTKSTTPQSLSQDDDQDIERPSRRKSSIKKSLSSPKKEKIQTEKCSMTQNYLPLTIQFFGTWIKNLPKGHQNAYTYFLVLLGNRAESLNLDAFEFEEKIFSYIDEHISGKSKVGKKGVEKKKITNKSQLKNVMTRTEKDSELNSKIKEVLSKMLVLFFLWPNYYFYLKTSKACLKSKLFLHINKEEICKNMTEANPQTPKFNKLAITAQTDKNYKEKDFDSLVTAQLKLFIFFACCPDKIKVKLEAEGTN